jgi:hypothetical protein
MLREWLTTLIGRVGVKTEEWRPEPAPMIQQPSSALPAPLFAALRRIAAARYHGESDRIANGEMVTELARLPVPVLPRADSEIAEVADLRLGYWARLEARERIAEARAQDIEEMARAPELRWLNLFHRDGWLREAALHAIDTAPPGPFLFAAIAYRLNDWVEPVRAAAVACAGRVFPLTDPDHIAEAAMYLLRQAPLWGRWTDERRNLFDAFDSPAVAAGLARSLMQARTGPTAVVLARALKTPALDHWLPELSRRAIQPSVRAIALRTLIQRTARWSEGLRRQWVDKTMGRFRMVPDWATRSVPTDLPIAELIDQGLTDPAVRVRLAAADAVTEADGDVERWVAAMEADHSPAVRERAALCAGGRRREH